MSASSWMYRSRKPDLEANPEFKPKVLKFRIWHHKQHHYQLCHNVRPIFFFSLSLKTLQLGKLKSPNPHKLVVILNLNFKCRFPLKWWCPLLEIHFSFLQVFNLNFMFAFEFAHESVHLYTLGKAFSCWVLCGICDL